MSRGGDRAWPGRAGRPQPGFAGAEPLPRDATRYCAEQQRRRKERNNRCARRTV